MTTTISASLEQQNEAQRKCHRRGKLQGLHRSELLTLLEVWILRRYYLVLQHYGYLWPTITACFGLYTKAFSLRSIFWYELSLFSGNAPENIHNYHPQCLNFPKLSYFVTYHSNHLIHLFANAATFIPLLLSTYPFHIEEFALSTPDSQENLAKVMHIGRY